jgi:hypothetical protein
VGCSRNVGPGDGMPSSDWREPEDGFRLSALAEAAFGGPHLSAHLALDLLCALALGKSQDDPTVGVTCTSSPSSAPRRSGRAPA